jgi:hypothetical protein
MQASFTELVGTAVVPAHCFDSDELTDLTPALDTVTAVRDMEAQASEGKATVIVCTVTFCPF